MSTAPGSMEKKEEIPLDGSHSGVIRFEVDKVSTLDENGRFIADIELGGVPWKAKIYKDVSAHDFLTFNIVCQHNQLTPWSLDVTTECTLFNSDSSMDMKSTEGTSIIHHSDLSWNAFILEWNDLLDESSGFIKDDKVTVEVRVCVSDMRNMRISPRIDFTDPNEPSHDIVVQIGADKVFENKAILAVHSQFFKAIFYGNLDEKNEKEFDLKGVDRKEFLDLLDMIYPCSKKVLNDDSVEYLLKLSHYFQIERVMELAEYHLRKSETIPNMEKLRIADKYPSPSLLKFCASRFWTAQLFKDIKESPIYADLSSETKAALFEGMVDAMN